MVEVDDRSGGEQVGEILRAEGVPAIFTLCGGHISPILVAARRREIRVIDTRHEASAVFAADAMGRLTATPGVAAVTAGPGVTNTVTALQNAKMAGSPLVVLGGATPTLLRGRGALQDVDQLALMRPAVKWATSVRRVRDVGPTLQQAFRTAREGIPGPVFVELPIDVLYPEAITRPQYQEMVGKSRESLTAKAVGWYVDRHLGRLFGGRIPRVEAPQPPTRPSARPGLLRQAAMVLARGQRPVLVVSTQAVTGTDVAALRASIERLQLPTYLSGGARGLLGPDHELLVRHKRRDALRQADVVILAGVPLDFRMGYGRGFAPGTAIIAANLDEELLHLNRRPTVPLLVHPADAIAHLAATASGQSSRLAGWREQLRQRDAERTGEIAAQAGQETEHINPLALCRAIDDAMGEDAVLVGDGGDFVGTASYIVRPRGPLAWLDPGPYGTLGGGGGFALGAAVARPGREVWVLYGDGSAAYSLAEIDTAVRTGLPFIAVVGNDAGWTQIARDQVTMLGDSVGTQLLPSDYHTVAEGYGGRGFLVERIEDVPDVLARARELARAGTPVLINARIGTTDFRQGSISV